MQLKQRIVEKPNRARKGTEVGMFLGSDGGVFGVGAPEVATILLVGYFILGPTDLFKLTKEVGKFIQNFRTLGAEATKSFESTMENQLELTELRKAQSELNSAFNFRRSINVDQESEAFSELPPIAEGAAVAGATAVAKESDGTSSTKRKKKRRRVKKKTVQEVPEETVSPFSGDIPDLDMSAAFQDEFKDQMGLEKDSVKDGAQTDETEAEMSARLRKERFERLERAAERSESDKQDISNDETNWFSASESDIASEVLAQQPSPNEVNAANDRFAKQQSGKWNDNVLENEDKLSPLAKIMDQIAIIEDERAATNMRLDEEFERRAQIEEKFYREKRELLEMAAGEVSAAAYSNFDFGEDAETNEEHAKGEKVNKDKDSALNDQKKDSKKDIVEDKETALNGQKKD